MNLLDTLIEEGESHDYLDEIALRFMPELQYHDASEEERQKFARPFILNTFPIFLLERRIEKSQHNLEQLAKSLDEFIGVKLVEILEGNQSIDGLIKIVAILSALELMTDTDKMDT